MFAAMFSCDEENSIFGNSDTAAGLKSALSVGIDTASNKLHKEDGYYKDAAVKIGIPESAVTTFSVINSLAKNSTVSTALKALGSNLGEAGTMEQTLELCFNRAAEDAAPKSVSIFKSAITGMTFADAENILFGASNAATQYLRNTTYTGLETAYAPCIDDAIDNVKVVDGLTANDAWGKYAEYNNKLATNIKSSKGQAALAAASRLGGSDLNSAIEKANSIEEAPASIGDYVTQNALNGLFTKVADQELQIRTNVNARVNDVLKKVFGRLDSERS